MLTSLSDADAFGQVASGPHGLVMAGEAQDRLLVELSTLALADKYADRRLRERRGWSVADALLNGTGAQAKTGDLVAFMSADDPADRARAITVLRLFTRPRDLDAAIRAVRDGVLQPGRLVTAEYPIEDVAAAIDAAAMPGQIKITVRTGRPRISAYCPALADSIEYINENRLSQERGCASSISRRTSTRA